MYLDFIFEGVGTTAEEIIIVAPKSFHLGWARVRPKNKAENEEGTENLFVVTKVNLLERCDVVFDERT